MSRTRPGAYAVFARINDDALSSGFARSVSGAEVDCDYDSDGDSLCVIAEN